ncbi:MAG: Hpt domain-containing protein [Rhodoferax sp.]
MHEQREALDLATTLDADTSTRPVKGTASSALEAEDSEQDVALPDHLEGLDIKLGLARAMGMKAFYVSMLRHYRESHNGTPARVRQALDAGDLGLAELLSHSLRGISGQIGATQVPSDAAALEQAIHENQSPQATDDLLGRLEVSVTELMAALNAAFPPVAAAQA